MARRMATAAILVLATLVFGCAGAPAETERSAATASALATPTPTRSAIPEQTGSGPSRLATCLTGSRCGVRAGAYYTDASGFFPGLVLTIPDGWSVTEHFPGELSLGPKDRPDDRLLLWKDMRVVVSNHKTDPAGTIVSNVASSPEALVKWFTTNEDFVVLDDPVPVAVAGAKGQALTVGVSVDADYADPGCPSNPRCADFVTDPRHWGGDFYGVGGETTIRMSILTVPYAADPHQFMVVLEVPSADDLAAFAAEAEPVVDSIVLPATYQAN